jgi:hypothetical protein
VIIWGGAGRTGRKDDGLGFVLEDPYLHNPHSTQQKKKQVPRITSSCCDLAKEGMSDDQHSASELRQYHDNGSIPNSSLSSSQIRARFGVPSNKKGNGLLSSHLTSYLSVFSLIAVLLLTVLILVVVSFST